MRTRLSAADKLRAKERAEEDAASAKRLEEEKERAEEEELKIEETARQMVTVYTTAD